MYGLLLVNNSKKMQDCFCVWKTDVQVSLCAPQLIFEALKLTTNTNPSVVPRFRMFGLLKIWTRDLMKDNHVLRSHAHLTKPVKIVDASLVAAQNSILFI